MEGCVASPPSLSLVIPPHPSLTPLPQEVMGGRERNGPPSRILPCIRSYRPSSSTLNPSLLTLVPFLITMASLKGESRAHAHPPDTTYTLELQPLIQSLERN